MKLTALLFLAALLASCNGQKEFKTETNQSIVGTWQLISVKTISGYDTTLTYYNDGVKGIKMMNESHFSFFQHDLNQGKDSTALYISGGGSYSYDGQTYIENLEYCNFRGYDNQSFSFKLEVNTDTLIQQGIEKIEALDVDKYIYETYHRVDH